MSRIIVKNLPPHVTEDKVRSHFEKLGSAKKAVVTDVRLVKASNGRFRGFGFIGYKDESEAQAAVDYFDSSFIGTSKLHVELAKVIGDDSIMTSIDKKARAHDIARKRAIKEEETLQKSKRAKTVKPKMENIAANDPRLAEYLGVMDANRAKHVWANDDMVAQATEALENATDNASLAALPTEGASDDEYVDVSKHKPEEEVEDELEDGVSLSEFVRNGEKPDSRAGDSNEDIEESNRIDEDGIVEEQGKAEGGADSEPVSDFDWLRMHQKRIPERDAEAVQEEVETEEVPGPVPETSEVDAPAVPRKLSEKEVQSQKIAETRRLFVRNLLYTTTESELRELFSKFGELEEMHLSIDAKSGKSKGIAFAMYQRSDDAVAAFDALDGQIFHGRLLHILAAQQKRSNQLDEFDLKDLPLKKQTELKRKFAAAKQQFSWNSLYLNEDAVRETVAKRLGITKAQLIDAHSSDAAVQQALAESSVINSVRQYFESKGVDLTSFNSQKRSDRVILAKNLPFETSAEEIRDMFGKHGEVTKVLMPPDGGIAILVFKTEPQGRAAFTKLAFRRIKTSILYLEKGPEALVSGELQSEVAATDGASADSTAKEVGPSARDLLLDTPADTTTATEETGGQTASVFIKNLNFKTTSSDLTKLFKPLDGFVVATVKTKADAKNPGNQLSMGFGFADFRSKQAAEVAIAAMDGHVLEGHKLQLKMSTREPAEADTKRAVSKEVRSSKILIKNVPFETTKKDIRSLFGPFGQLRSVRVPKKFNRTARGFAFAEFVTAKEAESAMKALQGTHLLGRRLVMEYAQSDAVDAEEEIARMEAKVRKQVTNETLAGLRLSGKRRMELDEDEGAA